MEAVEALLQSGNRRRPGAPPLIDVFLSAAKGLTGAVDDDALRVSRAYLQLLHEQTAVDHIKSTDEMVCQVRAAVVPSTRARCWLHAHMACARP
jgi:hypothetical protein